jgi:hypothetical protein
MNKPVAGLQWLTPVIPATQEAEIRRIADQTLSRKTHHTKKKGLVEWLKMKVLSSNSRTAKQQQQQQNPASF